MPASETTPGEPAFQTSAAMEIEKLQAENEVLRGELAQARERLKAARDLLRDKFKEHAKLAFVFADTTPEPSEPATTDLLGPHLPLLDAAPAAGIRATAEAVANLGGRAVVRQICVITKLSARTVQNYVMWLVKHGVFERDGKDVVLRAAPGA